MFSLFSHFYFILAVVNDINSAKIKNLENLEIFDLRVLKKRLIFGTALDSLWPDFQKPQSSSRTLRNASHFYLWKCAQTRSVTSHL